MKIVQFCISDQHSTQERLCCLQSHVLDHIPDNCNYTRSIPGHFKRASEVHECLIVLAALALWEWPTVTSEVKRWAKGSYCVKWGPWYSCYIQHSPASIIVPKPRNNLTYTTSLVTARKHTILEWSLILLETQILDFGNHGTPVSLQGDKWVVLLDAQ